MASNGEQQHSPLPWLVESHHLISRDAEGNVTANGNESIAVFYGPDRYANIKYADRAIRSHEALVDTLREVKRVLEAPTTTASMPHTYKKVCEALALAEKES